MIEATAQREGFGHRKKQTSRSKTQIFGSRGVDDDERSQFWRGLSVCCMGLLGGGSYRG